MGKTIQPGDRLLTCCYCGARSILPAGGGEKRLVCHGCGAPIREIERLRQHSRARPSGGKKKPAIPHPAERPGAHAEPDRPSRRKKGKRRKGIGKRVSKAFDGLEDLFDLFD